MASNHTTNYQLCQWEATDKVLRTDFNEDNQKIDAALASLSSQIPLIRLKHFVLSADTKSYALDLEDVDLEDYSGLRFVIKSTANTIGTFGLRLNGLEENYEYDSTSSYNPVSASAIPVCSVSPFLSQVDLRRFAAWTIFSVNSCVFRDDLVSSTWLRGLHRDVSYDNIQSITLNNLHETDLLSAGTEITAYGIK